MYSKSTKAMLGALLATSPHGKLLQSFLPPSLKQEINLTPVEPKESLVLSHWSDRIHYSWLYPILTKLPVESQLVFLSFLAPSQARGLGEMLHRQSSSSVVYSQFIRLFWLNYLKENLQPEDILPEVFLPPSPLNGLLLLERSQLIRLIDLLGLHDLSVDLKKIVDKELLGKIHSVLTVEQVQFLHYCSKQPVRWVSPKLELAKWDGTKKSLNHLLHHRGLIRLGGAILLEDPNFLWYLLHQLDTGRAKVVEKVLEQKKQTALVPHFKNQILHILHRFQT